jgi:hypothetical protein
MAGEPENLVLEMLKAMRRENRARFNAISRDMSAIHRRLDMLVTSNYDIAAAKLADLREMLSESIAQGGDNSADDVRRFLADRRKTA